jgi:hypothetical protein
MSTLQKTVKRVEKDVMEFEKERHKFLSVSCSSSVIREVPC